MLPNSDAFELDDELENDFETEVLPDKTYRLDFASNSINGMIDETTAREQAIMKIFMTEAEEYLIYDYDYGCALADLIGEQPPLVQSDIKDAIETGILSDDRFESVEFTNEKLERGRLTLSLTVTCTDGEEINLEEVEVDV
ncbi:DUF2634 domain-containing protein [Emergencia timonensis]|uniref:DUF2634 domain-containing protein n=1 Tax=Emergencia timonensis TaxID=1776384 RepID=UPI001D07D48F|nr:DUF2634 domain-containing protein [Emergencia timonensis]MCB6475608.1 DUF2634 domain-containing protein [Emergencia timonensis]